MAGDLKHSIFFLVGNIPPFFRSANLRIYFSQFVEKKLFVCFHFRHRPEQLRRRSDPHSSSDVGRSNVVATPSRHGEDKGGNPGTKCCVVAVGSEDVGKEFVKMYHKKNWSAADGSLYPGKVQITKLNVRIDSPSPIDVEDKSGKK